MRKLSFGMLFFLLLIGSDFFAMWIPEPAVAVKVKRVTFRKVTRSITAVGAIETAAKVIVNAPRGGKVTEVYFNELDTVHQGDILARLDDTELVAQLEQTKAALAQAQANLQAWEPILHRTERLYTKGFVAREEWEKAQQQYELYRLAVQERRSLYRKVRAQLAKTVIRAPMSGTVTRKLVGIGTGIAEIADLQKLEVYTNVDETDIGKIHVGQRARITVDAYPGQQFEGRVKAIALTTLTERKDLGIQYAVKVSIKAPSVPLRLGMTANVEFIITQKAHVLSIPVWALLQRDGTNIAFVVAGSRLHTHLVKTGVMGEEYVEVVSGLQPGQLVVVGDLSKLKDGQLVKDEANGLTMTR